MSQEQLKLKALTNWFNQKWEKYIRDTNDSKLAINQEMYDKLIEPIKDMKLTVTRHRDELVVDDWEYNGPGDINLEVYLDLDFILKYEIDHVMVAREFLLPWLRGLLKYFNFDLFIDFADVSVTFFDRDGVDYTYTVYGDEINTNNFYIKKPKYWTHND